MVIDHEGVRLLCFDLDQSRDIAAAFQVCRSYKAEFERRDDRFQTSAVHWKNYLYVFGIGIVAGFAAGFSLK